MRPVWALYLELIKCVSDTVTSLARWKGHWRRRGELELAQDGNFSRGRVRRTNFNGDVALCLCVLCQPHSRVTAEAKFAYYAVFAAVKHVPDHDGMVSTGNIVFE